MDAPRTMRRAIAEWVVAAAILVGVGAVGSSVVRDLRVVSPVMPVSAREVTAQQPTAGVPEAAVSVPLLLLPDDLEIRVGDAERGVRKRLAQATEIGAAAVERGAHGERQTRTIEYHSRRFVLVVEPFEQDAEPRVAAIYLYKPPTN